MPEPQPNTTPVRQLRQVVLLVFGSQLGLVLVTLALALWVGVPKVSTQGWATPMASVGFVLYMAVSGVCRTNFKNNPNFGNAFQAAVLLAGMSTVPALLACVLIAVAGPSTSALALGVLSALLLASSLGRVTGFGKALVLGPPQPSTFQGWALSKDDDRHLRNGLGIEAEHTD